MQLLRLNVDGSVTDVSGDISGDLPDDVIFTPPEVQGVDTRFLKHEGVIVMYRSQEEIDAIRAADAEAAKEAESAAAMTPSVLAILDLINALQTACSITPTTQEELRLAIKAKL